MSLDKIFNLFDVINEDIDPIGDEAFAFTDTPMFHLGMFKKIIWNQKHFETKMGQFKKLYPESKIFDDKEAGEFVTFTRAYFYINKFDFEHPLAKDSIKLFSDIYTKTACELSLSFFEEKEEYEKCIKIKKVLDALNLNLEA
jgi:hypothetical protein